MLNVYCFLHIPLFYITSVSDHVLVGHVISTSTVADEFECHQKCLRNNSCKSFNVHPGADISTNDVCELNNETRKMKPDDFIKKKGSSYYGQLIRDLKIRRRRGQRKRHLNIQAMTKFSFSYLTWIKFLGIQLQESSYTFEKVSEMEQLKNREFTFKRRFTCRRRPRM